jgi:hypothetical protein
VSLTDVRKNDIKGINGWLTRSVDIGSFNIPEVDDAPNRAD